MKLMFKFKDGMIVENDVGDGNESGNGEIFSMFAKGKMSNATISINGQEERKYDELYSVELVLSDD